MLRGEAVVRDKSKGQEERIEATGKAAGYCLVGLLKPQLALYNLS